MPNQKRKIISRLINAQDAEKKTYELRIPHEKLEEEEEEEEEEGEEEKKNKTKTS